MSQSDVDKAKAWVYKMYRMADSKVDMVSMFINDEGVFSVMGSPPAKDQTRLHKCLGIKLWALNHKNWVSSAKEISVSDPYIFVKLSATYQFKSGSQQVIKCLATWHKSLEESHALGVEIDGDFSKSSMNY
ncbi:unnamed protein product [Cyclocybe aegerita]|uniref:Uncharacterized protein n=1 Tax=Cyclocybe aegerita TaxID=1973307 RepID=A0A8S0WUP9_CYCAE|nr:unnamed protein product [Cyclocybe aegerita]